MREGVNVEKRIDRLETDFADMTASIMVSVDNFLKDSKEGTDARLKQFEKLLSDARIESNEYKETISKTINNLTDRIDSLITMLLNHITTSKNLSEKMSVLCEKMRSHEESEKNVEIDLDKIDKRMSFFETIYNRARFFINNIIPKAVTIIVFIFMIIYVWNDKIIKAIKILIS